MTNDKNKHNGRRFEELLRTKRMGRDRGKEDERTKETKMKIRRQKA